MNPRELVHPHFLIGAIAVNVELVEAGYQTAGQACARIHALLVASHHFHPLRPAAPKSSHFEATAPATMNDSRATKVGDSTRNISAPGEDRSPQRPQSPS